MTLSAWDIAGLISGPFWMVMGAYLFLEGRSFIAGVWPWAAMLAGSFLFWVGLAETAFYVARLLGARA